MTGIKNIKGVREAAIDILSKLRNGEISTSEALAAQKACESIIHTVKMELDYSKATEQMPYIPFMVEDMPVNPQLTIDHDPIRQLDHQK